MNRLRKFLSLQPLSLRGLIAIALSIGALKYFAIPQSDLVAYVISLGILSLAFIVLLVALITRLRLTKGFYTEMQFARENNYSKTEVPAGIIVKGSHVPPFFTLSLNRRFQQDNIESKTHLLTGRSIKRHLIDAVNFPHRGLWTVDGLDICLSDTLGFSRIKWKQASIGSVEVSATPIPIQPLPIVVASNCAGDQSSEQRERSGDLFDIKPYDPSDGITKILWKTFAKSGQLVVRRPEPAVIPEGEVAIYLIANRNEDHVAGALLGYLRQLEENQISVLFGTDGMAEDNLSANYVTLTEGIKRLMNRSVWSIESGTGAGFESYVEALNNDYKNISRVIVFAPARSDEWFEQVTKIASLNSIALSVALVRESLEESEAAYGFKPEENKKLLESLTTKALAIVASPFPRISRAFNSRKVMSSESDEIRLLSSRITKAGGELIICEGV